MNVANAIEFMSTLSEGKDFLEKNPQYDVIIKTIYPNDIIRILSEYPGLFPFKVEEYGGNFNIISISVVSRKISPRGYPKFRVYIKESDNEVLRILLSE